MAKRGKHGKWSEEDLQHAIRVYRNNIYGPNQCQRVYGVPKATIKRHSDNKNIFVNEQKKLVHQLRLTQTWKKNLLVIF